MNGCLSERVLRGNVMYIRLTCLSKHYNRSKSHATPTFFEIGDWSQGLVRSVALLMFINTSSVPSSSPRFQTTITSRSSSDFPPYLLPNHLQLHTLNQQSHPTSPTMPDFSWKKIKDFGISETEKDRFCAIFLTNVEAFKVSTSLPFPSQYM